ncbi:DEAD-box ATP-dependent RNA helicase cshA [Paraglaciecola mesophila KMM 241]|uniref:DEAD-box ATP-dependent RNA helicase cshA n=1 Tax=Paraglaciecola mesophila KMM 241 TaxID=1128912 RepID=K6ZMP8_9ALTE|nr:ATP-dependent RNA helicase DbpA [Paraglaciecola mesophila]GAC24645.1 DEAD-box ATP-dependent RNA helicase cshA [Paraglaciecola mesophila KMM 241]
MSKEFSSLGLEPALLDNLQSMGFSQMTEIQAGTLPAILEGRDVVAKAKTGSGKTAAFGLALLHNLDVKRFRVQALVMCPTRELAEQVALEIRRLGRGIHNIKVLTLCGGTPMGPQIGSLEHGAHIIVGTPGRIMDHLYKRRLDLSEVNTLVLDEADRMLDMGFEDEMDAVIKSVPEQRQTLLFSATYPDSIAAISGQVQKNPLEVTVESTHDTDSIQQVFFEVEDAHRTKAVAALLSHYQPESAIVFCNTKIACQEVADELQSLGVSVLALHGDLEQRERNQVLVRFANKSVSVLVATDVASRGLDIKEVNAVISYHITPDPEVHIHRIGRTGRAESKGVALTLVAPDEMARANAIEDYQKAKLKWTGIQAMRFHANRLIQPQYSTLCVDGGKKAKLRPGDLLGALTKEAEIPGDDIGKIHITEFHAYVAVKTRSVKRAMRQLGEGKIKGKKFKVRKFN